MSKVTDLKFALAYQFISALLERDQVRCQLLAKSISGWCWTRSLEGSSQIWSIMFGDLEIKRLGGCVVVQDAECTVSSRFDAHDPDIVSEILDYIQYNFPAISEEFIEGISESEIVCVYDQVQRLLDTHELIGRSFNIEKMFERHRDALLSVYLGVRG